jgi:hypothetical protein
MGTHGLYFSKGIFFGVTFCGGIFLVPLWRLMGGLNWANKKPPAWAEGFDSNDMRLLPLHKKKEAGRRCHETSGYTRKRLSATFG